MVLLRDWLEERRVEAESQFGRPLSRPEVKEPEGSKELSEALQRTADLVASLTKDVDADPNNHADEEQARWLLAQLLGWHRREAKSGWWAYYDRIKKTPEDLVEDADSLGALGYEGIVDELKKSKIHAFSFPAQEHKITVGSYVDPVTQARVNVERVDNVQRRLLLRRGKSSKQPLPAAIIPPTPYDTSTQRKALERMAESVIAKGLNGDGPYRAARDLLQRIPPRLRNGTPGASLQQSDEPRIDAACRIASQLDRSNLPIQGPPGTGKTYTGAHLIIALIQAGHGVGITATSHKVITNLLDETCEMAQKKGLELRALQKAGKDEASSDHDFVEVVSSNSDFQDAWATGNCQIAAGTAWLFSREDIFEKLHTLVIDEAGQFSLADALAVSGSARNLVLLGDPQQLAQPSQGVHPPGSEASVLEHVLNGRDTIQDDYGLFLATTWRMHPNVCSFISNAFYDGRLESEPHTKQQRVEPGGTLDGSGVHFIGVEHSGNRVASPEEVKVIADLVKDLLKQRWINEKGEEVPIAHSEVLVVAPYNRQVAELRLSLPEGVPVGTVDKFQGQGGAVTIYSLTTSDPEDIPRNFEFLYSHNRLNVAVSRARAISIVVGSPRLLQPRCGRPEQMRLANALCLYKETADKQRAQVK